MGDQLTMREKTCLHWVAKGKSSWEIGSILCISEHTVNFHVKNAMAKLFTTKRTVAALVAMERGILSSAHESPECAPDLKALKQDKVMVSHQGQGP